MAPMAKEHGYVYKNLKNVKNKNGTTIWSK